MRKTSIGYLMSTVLNVILIVLLPLILPLGGCGGNNEMISYPTVPSNFKRPIIVIGVCKSAGYFEASAVIRDSTGKTYTTTNSVLARVISENYVKGDTLK